MPSFPKSQAVSSSASAAVSSNGSYSATTILGSRNAVSASGSGRSQVVLIGEHEESEIQAIQLKLWIMIARHVIERCDGDSAVRVSVAFLKSSNGLLKVEDLLGFFPNFTVIDNFRAAITDSLHVYSHTIDGLKNEMEDATLIADAVSQDIHTLAHRTAAVSLKVPCARCGSEIGWAPPAAAAAGFPSGGCLVPFLVFPTGLAYHTACAAAEVAEVAAPPLRRRIQNLVTRLTRANFGSSMAPPYAGAPAETIESLQGALIDLIGGDDPRNGENLVQLIGLPFLWDTDALEAESWAL